MCQVRLIPLGGERVFEDGLGAPQCESQAVGQLRGHQVDGDQGFRFSQGKLQLAKAVLRFRGVRRNEQYEGGTVDDGRCQLIVPAGARSYGVVVPDGNQAVDCFEFRPHFLAVRMRVGCEHVG